MLVAPLPEDEEERLAALRAYAVLDTPAEDAFDDLVRIAQHICGTPIVLVSLVDQDRQWFKAKVGLDAEQTPRDVAFCAHAIHDTSVFEVPDAHEDARFADNPLVTGAPNVRYYAGTPLITPGGHALGTLCVIDHVARRLSPAQTACLEALGREVVAQLELRRQVAELARTTLALQASRDALELAKEEVERASEAKSRFVATVSHELRTPLNAIIGYAGLLSEDAAEPEVRRDLGRIEAAGHQLLGLVNQILDLALVESGSMEVHIDRFEVGELLRTASDTALPLVQRGGNVLVVNDGVGSVSVSGDGARIYQVLMNLLANAAKFTEDGEITVTSGFADGRLRLSVADTGIGLSPADTERIFEPFRQADTSSTRKYGGTGLGLSISRHFAEAMGGSLTVTSEAGVGSTFVLDVPVD